MELLKQIAPQVSRAAVIYDPTNRESKEYVPPIEAVAPSLGVQITVAAVRDNADIEHAIDEVAREFQLDEIGPTAPAGHSRIAGDVYGSEVFLQNLGDVLSRFRMNPAETVPPRERKS